MTKNNRELSNGDLQDNNAFRNFATTILKIYNRDREAFWNITLSQFLSDQFSMKDTLQKVKLGLELFKAFKGLSQYRTKVLQEFSQSRAIDINCWKSNRKSYFTDAYPIFALLVIWMEENKLGHLLNRFDEILKAAVFAVAGYGILDENVDGNTSNPTEILTAQALICEYEFLILNVMGATPNNLGTIHKMRSLYFEAEIREKACRNVRSPYCIEAPEQLGVKGANAVTPFMLCLEQLDKSHLIDKYWQVFLLFGAAIQFIDDWKDLEQDLEAGHYSYMTLGQENSIKKLSPKVAATKLKADKKLILESYHIGKELIAASRTILDELDDPILVKLVDITELQFDKYFRRELKIETTN